LQTEKCRQQQPIFLKKVGCSVFELEFDPMYPQGKFAGRHIPNFIQVNFSVQKRFFFALTKFCAELCGAVFLFAAYKQKGSPCLRQSEPCEAIISW
jgi:hypothetical protein